jgi:transcription elongation GreA/GreB family factor
MSRAFVKELDEAPPQPALLERSISAAPNRVTPRGARLINEAVDALEQELGRTDDENVPPLLARDLRYWRARQASMQVVTPDPAPAAVGFGARVTIRRGTTESQITIVGEDEADPKAGLIAWTAPIARALDGAAAGDVVEFEMGGRLQPIAVVAIAPARDER